MGCCQKNKQKENTETLINKNNISSENAKETNENKSEEKEACIEVQTYDKIKITINDFDHLKLLGTGSFGRVILVRLKFNQKLYAMKILSKNQIKQRHQEDHTKTERDLMVKINSPFVVNIKLAFQDEIRLYIVSDFMQGGDMFYHLHIKKFFSEETTKFYLIEIILALEFLHKNNMIYRDLKPENILMDEKGHIKISDFGLSKILKNMDDKAFTLCGTPQYIAPEVLKNKGYDKNIDWWSVGCFLYEMVTGHLPFLIKKGTKINTKIYDQPLKFPNGLSKEVIDLTKKLLNPNPKKRLGHGTDGAQKIKEHPFFQNVDWEKYYNKEINPPFIPELNGEEDLRYFDKMFTDEPVDINRPTNFNRSRAPLNYQGFTFVTESVANGLNYKNGDKTEYVEQSVSENDLKD